MRTRRRILILSGPTREYLDPVRYLTNASSGRQGMALAEEALSRGHAVDLVQGPSPLPAPAGSRLHAVVSSEEMLRTALEFHPDCDVLIGAAAVCDYRPVAPLDRKRKRAGGRWTLDLVPNPDILEELARRKGSRVHVGFALETDDLVGNSRRKLRAKSLDWIVANSPSAIDAENAEYIVLGADGSRRDLGTVSKTELARVLLDLVDSAQDIPGPSR